MEESITMSVSGGFFGDSCVVMEGDKKVFYKTAKRSVYGLVRGFENKFLRCLSKHDPFRKHIDVSASSRNQLEKEVLTWGLWRDEGIEVPELIHYDKKSVKYEFISDGSPYTKIIDSSGDFSKFDKFLETYDKIRWIAKKKGDPNYLHSDPHFGNFLYSDSRGVMPIDAGTVLDPKMSFDEIDARLIGHTFRSLINLNLGEVSLKNHTRRFKDILTSEEIGRVVSIDYNLSGAIDIYLSFREDAIRRLRGRGKIPQVSKRRAFVKQMENVKDALS